MAFFCYPYCTRDWVQASLGCPRDQAERITKKLNYRRDECHSALRKAFHANEESGGIFASNPLAGRKGNTRLSADQVAAVAEWTAANANLAEVTRSLWRSLA